MQKLVKKRAMLQAKADRQEELEALMLDVAQVGREIENKDAEMKETAREFKELTEDKATTAFGQMEQVLAEAGHELAEGTKAKLKAALLTTTAEDEIGPDPFLSRFDSREPFPQELAGINQGSTVWPASYGPARGTPAIARATPLNPPSRKDEIPARVGWEAQRARSEALYPGSRRRWVAHCRCLEGCPGQWFNFAGLEGQVVAWQALLSLTQSALVSETPSEPDILSLVEQLEHTLDDGSLEHWVCHHILDALSSPLFSREMWYVAVQAVQEVLNTSDPGVSRKLTCITANVTQWRKEVATWLFELGPDVAAVQETHLDQTEIRQVQIEAGKAGYQFQALPAGQGKGVGTLGRVAILTKNHLGARLVDSFVTKEGCGWIAVALRVHGRDLILFSLYLQSGVGPTGGCNPEVLANLASTLSQLQGVWVVMGDFNHPRLEMANLGLVTQVLVGPGCPTAGGENELDYAMVHSALEGSLEASFSMEVSVAWYPNLNCSQLSRNWVASDPYSLELGEIYRRCEQEGLEREGGGPLATLEGKKKGGCDGWSYAALRLVALLPKDEHKERLISLTPVITLMTQQSQEVVPWTSRLDASYVLASTTAYAGNVCLSKA
ncbi:unnamed protein product [Symbiodinium necroappetens]|uniref:Endonuclease/exonuclease/phosphatase domain-containing protein n=1 Tax=Symbiodinium necroappetens TaxID=1628268 RepID=A0A812XY44_9DINO|nr:unnamed protein product [Symbiodinium necroappetens]